MGIAIVIITKTDGNCKGKSKFWEQDSKIFYYCVAGRERMPQAQCERPSAHSAKKSYPKERQAGRFVNRPYEIAKNFPILYLFTLC
jgi:hypothetical protein